MKVTLKKLAKCLFRSGRREFVREMIEQELTRDKILGYVNDGVVYGLNRGINAIPEQKRASLHTSLSMANHATTRLLEVTDPESEGGFLVSARESDIISGEIACLTKTVFTDDTVRRLHEKIIERIP